MSAKISRRDLVKGAAAGAVAVAGARIFETPYIMAAEPGKKLRTAVIGCGGRGSGYHIPLAARENLVALVDVDDKNIANGIKQVKDKEKTVNTDAIKTFNDYRKFFDVMAKEVDAVFIATPNHHHALPALMAMERGISVYVEKPMAYNISEARLLAEASKKYKVATQMGNQGHSGEGYRRLVEYIQAGAIGNVTEVYHWSDCENGGVGPRPPALPVPANLHWEEWIGPAPYRDYHKDLHPHEWHGWHDFGGGALGNRGCHIMDGAHWALNLNGPCTIELEDANGGTNERFPLSSRICWTFPKRGDMAPVKVWWYDGRRKGATGKETGATADSVADADRVRPPILVELEKQYGKDRFEGNATIYKGDKGLMYTGFYGGGVRIIPEEQQKATPVPEAKIPRIKGSHTDDFLRGVRDPSYKPCANFEVSAPLTELTLLGVLAARAGAGKKVEWDGNKCTNTPAVNNDLQREGRKGWELPKL
jgi:predicted dehydrogenase